MNKLFDPIRNIWVSQSPEELVRQKFISMMLELGFPKEFIAVEKKIPDCYGKYNRRFDILLFDRSCKTVLLVECKRGRCDYDTTLRQILGYNDILSAPFMSIADDFGMRFYFERGKKFIDYLPSYKELMNFINE